METLIFGKRASETAKVEVNEVLKTKESNRKSTDCFHHKSKDKIRVFWSSLIIILMLFSLTTKAQNPVDWHGYMQLREKKDYINNYDISVRRLKFWVNSTPDFSSQWAFKVQVLFTPLHQNILFLQDVKAEYTSKNGNHTLVFGQFTPTYSLQWTQPDYLISAPERAQVINTLVPSGTMGVRDRGIQYNLKAMDKKLVMNFGVFKGRGIIDYSTKGRGYLLTQNTFYKYIIKKSKIKFGYSVMYRKANGLQLKYIFADSILFTGDDFRANFYGIYQSKYFNVQAEYLNAFFNGVKASGYYALATLKFNPKNQLFISYDKYNDLISSTEGNPIYLIGYNYLIKGYKLMLTLEAGFREQAGVLQNFALLEFQMFLN